MKSMYYFINGINGNSSNLRYSSLCNSLYTLRFRFICKCKTVEQEIQDDCMAWGNALSMAHSKQDREAPKYTDEFIADSVAFQDEILNNYFSLRSCKVVVPESIKEIGLSAFQTPDIKTPYTRNSIVGISCIDLFKTALYATSDNRDDLASLIRDLNCHCLDRIGSFIADNFETSWFSIEESRNLDNQESILTIPPDFISERY